jgi:hypothetical protein
MYKKVFNYMILGLGVYGLTFALVTIFYKDDPQGMIWQDREAFNKRYFSRLHLDSPIFLDHVFNQLGSPDLTFAKRIDADVYQIIYYRTDHKHADGITTKDECTSMLFKNERLVDFGNNAELKYDKVAQ